VKEDILCRWGELGVFVEAGQIHFRPQLLRREEFLRERADFRYFDLTGAARRLRLPANSLAFTCCQTPVIYKRARNNSLVVRLADGGRLLSKDPHLDPGISRLIFERTGKVARVEVSIRL
jgi:hypothetical protein